MVALWSVVGMLLPRLLIWTEKDMELCLLSTTIDSLLCVKHNCERMSMTGAPLVDYYSELLQIMSECFIHVSWSAYAVLWLLIVGFIATNLQSSCHCLPTQQITVMDLSFTCYLVCFCAFSARQLTVHSMYNMNHSLLGHQKFNTLWTPDIWLGF